MFCFPIVFICFSCSENSNSGETDKEIALSIVKGDVCQDSLMIASGSDTLTINSSYTLWQVSIGNVVEGSSFISELSIQYGGDSDTPNFSDKVVFYYESNSSIVVNKQYLVVESVGGQIKDSILLIQKAVDLSDPVAILTLNPSTTYQTISGFGGANTIWGTDFLSETEMDLAFGTGDDQMGLSIMRVRLCSDEDDWTDLASSIKYAKSNYDVKIIATPWSPPATWKSNASINGAGYLLEDYYDDFINYINDYIEYMDNNGVDIDVVSLQNEPDIEVDYEGCEYTTTQMFNLVKNKAKSISGAKVTAAESFWFNKDYTDDILNDSAASAAVDIISGHLYGTTPKRYPLAETKGKEIWMTEFLLNQDNDWSTNANDIWAETMTMVEGVQKCMMYNFNAYVWWYIRRYYSFLGDGENSTTKGTILKRGYAYSQFSKFVRPDYVRINLSFDEISDFSATAYFGNDKYVIVIINPLEQTQTITVDLPVGYSKVISYTTSIDKNREKVVMSSDDGEQDVALSSESICTIVIE